MSARYFSATFTGVRDVPIRSASTDSARRSPSAMSSRRAREMISRVTRVCKGVNDIVRDGQAASKIATTGAASALLCPVGSANDSAISTAVSLSDSGCYGPMPIRKLRAETCLFAFYNHRMHFCATASRDTARLARTAFAVDVSMRLIKHVSKIRLCWVPNDPRAQRARQGHRAIPDLSTHWRVDLRRRVSDVRQSVVPDDERGSDLPVHGARRRRTSEQLPG